MVKLECKNLVTASIASDKGNGAREDLSNDLNEPLSDQAASMADMDFLVNFEAGESSDMSYLDDLPTTMDPDLMVANRNLDLETEQGIVLTILTIFMD
jgi:hypothetical protein